MCGIWCSIIKSQSSLSSVCCPICSTISSLIKLSSPENCNQNQNRSSYYSNLINHDNFNLLTQLQPSESIYDEVSFLYTFLNKCTYLHVFSFKFKFRTLIFV